MLKRLHFPTFAAVMLGALLGYSVASGKLPEIRRVHAATTGDHPEGARSEGVPTSSPTAACCDGLDKGTLLALAATRSAEAGEPRAVRESPDPSAVRGSPDPSAVRGSPDPAQAAAQKKKASKKAASGKKPNILIIWGDDIGYWNPSCYHRGMMGYKTPNIDRIAAEGALFTDWYGQQSCTAGRACFITGQVGFRTGLLKVGLPGAKEGLQAEDVTLAQLLKARGYMTAQFGKNHLGDRDEHLPTAHGFDEFMGSLYHLNAEDEPEHPDYFKDPEMRKKFGTRGVIHTWANADGTQKIESTGPLTKKRMETIDEEITKASLDYLEKAKKADKPFFLWWNSTRMHIWTRLKKESEGKTGLGLYPDGMVEHDAMVGQLLDKLKELGLDDNTIVMYSTDNGAEKMSWPDGGQSPFRSEKGTNWEGGFRVPCAIRWPGVIKPGTVFNDIFAHEDMLPTLLAAAGDPDVKDKLLKGMKVGDKTFKVHLDGYNITDALAGKSPSPRHDFDPCVVAAACASFSRDSRGFYLPKGCSFVYSNSEMERSVAVSRGRIECGRAA